MSRKRKSWLPEEDKIIIDEVSKIPPEHVVRWHNIADKIDDVTAEQCRRRYIEAIDPKFNHDKFSEQELQYIKEKYQYMSYRMIAKELNRSIAKVRSEINRIKKFSENEEEGKGRGKEKGKEKERGKEEEEAETERRTLVKVLDYYNKELDQEFKMLEEFTEKLRKCRKAREELTIELQKEKDNRNELINEFHKVDELPHMFDLRFESPNFLE